MQKPLFDNEDYPDAATVPLIWCNWVQIGENLKALVQPLSWLWICAERKAHEKWAWVNVYRVLYISSLFSPEPIQLHLNRVILVFIEVCSMLWMWIGGMWIVSKEGLWGWKSHKAEWGSEWICPIWGNLLPCWGCLHTWRPDSYFSLLFNCHLVVDLEFPSIKANFHMFIG